MIAAEVTDSSEISVPQPEVSLLKILGEKAFYGCESLKNILLPEGLKTIGIECFKKSGIGEITLPANVREVGVGAFAQCGQLESVKLSKVLAELESRESSSEDGEDTLVEKVMDDVQLTFALKRIEARTFAHCGKLKSIEIPNGVEYIGDECF